MKFAEWRLWVCKLPKCTLASLMCEAGHVYKLPKCGFVRPEGKTRFVGWAGPNGRRYDDEMASFVDNAGFSKVDEGAWNLGCIIRIFTGVCRIRKAACTLNRRPRSSICL